MKLEEGMNSKLNPFCKVVEMMRQKHHLSTNGIEKIKFLKEDFIRDSLDAGNPHVQWGAE
jgi:hypothetical protein